MKAFIRGGCVALTAAALVVSTAGVAAAKPKKQSAAKYAKVVCTAYTSFTDAAKTYSDALNALDPTDPPTYTTQAVAATNTFLTTIKASATKLTGVVPDVSKGTKVAGLLNARATTIQSGVSAALTALQTANPPTATAVAQFSAAITTLFAQLTADDPFSKITDQTVLTAFQKEKLCKTVVRVIG
jgi:hypothetical protein